MTRYHGEVYVFIIQRLIKKNRWKPIHATSSVRQGYMAKFGEVSVLNEILTWIKLFHHQGNMRKQFYISVIFCDIYARINGPTKIMWKRNIVNKITKPWPKKIDGLGTYCLISTYIFNHCPSNSYASYCNIWKNCMVLIFSAPNMLAIHPLFGINQQSKATPWCVLLNCYE